MANPHSDLFVCGGGVVGLSIAWQAARLGWKVVVCDSRAIGKGASWAGAGILPASSPNLIEDPLEQLRTLSHLLHPVWSQELREKTGIDNGYRACGGVYLARTPGEFATLSAQQSLWSDLKIPFERWSERTTRENLPELCHGSDKESAPSIRGAWFLPTEAQLRNPRHLQALSQACRSEGVLLLEHLKPIQFRYSEGQIEGIETPTGTWTAQRYCLAAGAWTPQLLSSFNIPSGILPVRGQMVLYRFPQKKWNPVLNEGHRYLVPREDGHVLAGSCEEEVGYDESTTESMIEQLHRWAISIVPEIAKAQRVRAWAGLRPGSFDALPYLGKLPGFQNAYIAAGHFRHGLHLSPGTAKVLVDLMAGHESVIDLQPFRVARGHAFDSFGTTT